MSESNGKADKKNSTSAKRDAREILETISIDRYKYVSNQLDALPIEEFLVLLKAFEANQENITIRVLNYKLGRRQIT